MPWNGSWIFILIAFVRLLPAMHYHVIPQRTWIKVCAIALAALHCNYTDHNCTWFSVGSLWIHLMFAPFHIHHNNIWFHYALNPCAPSVIVFWLICTRTGHRHIWFLNALIPCALWALVCRLIPSCCDSSGAATRALNVDLLSQSSQPNTSPSCLISTCFVILQLWFALYSHKSQWYHKLLWVLWIWESNMAVWIPS